MFGQEVAEIVEAVGGDDAASRAAGDAALPPDEAEGEQDGDGHDADTQRLGLEMAGVRGEEAVHRAPCDGDCGDGDKDGLAERSEIFGGGVAEGMVFVGGFGGVEDGGHGTEADHEVHGAVGQRGGDGERAGLSIGPELQSDEQGRDNDRGEACGHVHADDARGGHERDRASGRWAGG